MITNYTVPIIDPLLLTYVNNYYNTQLKEIMLNGIFKVYLNASTNIYTKIEFLKCMLYTPYNKNYLLESNYFKSYSHETILDIIVYDPHYTLIHNVDFVNIIIYMFSYRDRKY